MVLVEVSNGELLDKYSILLLKSQWFGNEHSPKLETVEKEIEVLRPHVMSVLGLDKDISVHFDTLFDINSKLWELEDRVRDHIRESTFDDEFIQIAIDITVRNTERFNAKRTINLKTGSFLREEKTHNL